MLSEGLMSFTLVQGNEKRRAPVTVLRSSERRMSPCGTIQGGSGPLTLAQISTADPFQSLQCQVTSNTHQLIFTF